MHQAAGVQRGETLKDVFKDGLGLGDMKVAASLETIGQGLTLQIGSGSISPALFSLISPFESAVLMYFSAQ